ncbi:MAG: transglycosylase SLT domain-containing protein [Pseudomonadota bacterium]
MQNRSRPANRARASFPPLVLGLLATAGPLLSGDVAHSAGTNTVVTRSPTDAGRISAAPIRLALNREGQKARGLATTPDAVDTAEIEHNRIFDAAVKPLLDLNLSDNDAEALKAAFKALAKKDVGTATALQRGLQNPVARKLVTWDRLRRGLGSRSETERFLNDNPLWPNAWKLFAQIEQKLFDSRDNGATLAFYKTNEPASPLGAAALASALAASGQQDKARALTQRTWRMDDFTSDEESAFLSRHQDSLTPADHKWRLDRLLTNDFRWRGSRNSRAAIVRRQMKRVPAAERKIADARLAVFLRKKNALRKINALPGSTASDWSLAYHKVQQFRRSKQTSKAAQLLLSAPTATSEIVNPDAWWEERRVNAYVALRKKNPKLAYAIVQDAGDLSDNPKKQQAFVAGWLALRFLGDPKTALAHFSTMYDAADGPLSRSKSAYWMARTHETLGNGAEARSFYQQSAKQVDTFHGQISRQILAGDKPLTVTISPPAAPSNDQVRRFRSTDAAQAAVIAEKAGLGRTITRPFLANLANHLTTEAEVALAAHLTRNLGDTQQSLRIGKKAIGRDMNLLYYAYPLHAFPDYKPLRSPPEKAFLLGIARQESEFNTNIVSGAGARGILQVMKITARHVCRDYRIKCQYKRLLTDEAYNTKIASAYIADRMGEFNGSYILGMAGYNAGPGRARQWIKQFGDPRSPNMDPMDWIERIPFTETRKYVQKVLSNVQVYRARLGEKRSLRLLQDLRRAKTGNGRNAKLYAPGGRIARIQ